ncbi:MAG: FG-GAP-like repeat-containing protein [Planctomycetaceae bacterium]
MDSAPSPRVNVTWHRSLIAVGLVILASATYSLFSLFYSPYETTYREAQNAFELRDFVSAEKLAARIPVDSTAVGPRAKILAADAAERQSRFDSALEYLEQVPDSTPVSEEARLRCGDMLLGVLLQPSRAEQHLRRVLKINPQNVNAHDRLAFLYGFSASSWEAIPHRIQLLRYDRYNAVHLFLLCVGDTALENSERIPALLKSAPDDPRVLLGAARVAVDQQNYESAKAMLKHAIDGAPDLVEPYVKLGQLIQEDSSPAEYVAWNASLPKAAEDHPGIWATRGTWLMLHGKTDFAIRCFWESVRRDPNHERANYQLGQLLLGRGDSKRAEPFVTRSKRLNDYFNAVKIGYTGSDDAIVLRSAIIAETLGLNWEAGAWYRLLEKRGVFRTRAEGLKRLSPYWATLPLERAVPTVNPTVQTQLTDYSLPPDEKSLQDLTVPAGSSLTASVTDGSISYQDLATEASLKSQYFNGAPLGKTLHRMYEFTGGGTAAFDYDCDGHPDLYFAQGCDWPPAENSSGYLDRLFRNRGDGSFEDVTDFAQIVERGFSQGVAAGDFDNDGFSDLYVANIGLNRFFHNNGDGTFSDVTIPTGTSGNDSWSTSCALADFNSDGNLDLYVVNYLSGSDLFDRICPDVDGRVRSCSPRHFPAAQDQMWLSLGDGTFEEITADSGIIQPDGKGLGIVVGDFDASGRLGIFIANDAVPNFFFVRQSDSAASPPRFEEVAMISGCAVDIDGRPQACMGIAAGDAYGDGRLDLFVTNFYNECNTLYRNLDRGIFEDATRKSRLYDVSLKNVGFGAQFIDGDLDGRLDLVLVNGDVDDLREIGRDYAQRPQFLWNAGKGIFQELQKFSPGPYFTNKTLGRSLTRLDWNRDGREDFVVSHLDAPLALLTNRSDAGKSVTIRLVGTKSPRDPIGTTVVGQVAGIPITRQLTAGDGYMSSNERILVFGLGKETLLEQIEIHWPSGTTTQIPSLKAGTEVVVIEGKSNAIEFDR